jgi:hypothetical protein
MRFSRIMEAPIRAPRIGQRAGRGRGWAKGPSEVGRGSDARRARRPKGVPRLEAPAGAPADTPGDFSTHCIVNA